MYITIGETRLLVGQFGDTKTDKLELNFEYAFVSHSSYRRFLQAIADTQGNIIKIKIKSEFKETADCLKLSQLLVGAQKLLTPENLLLINEILESDRLSPEDFVAKQQNLAEYFT